MSSVVLSRGNDHAGDPITGRMCAFSANAVQRIRLLMGLFAICAPQSLFHGAAHGPRRRGRGNFSVELRRRIFRKRPRPQRPNNRSRKFDLDRLLGRRLNFPDSAAKKTALRKKTKNGSRKKGIGIAAFLHGAGFTVPATLSEFRWSVWKRSDGKVRVLVSSADLAREQIPFFAISRRMPLGLP